MDLNRTRTGAPCPLHGPGCIAHTPDPKSKTKPKPKPKGN